MGRTTTIALRQHVDDEMLLQLSRAMTQSALYRPPGFLDGPPVEDDEDEERALFGDHDIRATDRGFFAHSEEECRSRRVDLRGPTDRDPGPLAMGEAPARDLEGSAGRTARGGRGRHGGRSPERRRRGDRPSHGGEARGREPQRIVLAFRRR